MKDLITMSDSNKETQIITFGKFTGVIFPEVYFQFVSTLYREHDDLVRGMVLAKVTLRDGSALDYLNTILGTKVSRDTPMEIGYKELLNALSRRTNTSKVQATVEHDAPVTRTELPPEAEGKLFPDPEDIDGHYKYKK
jgi:hypothetical protein